MNLQKTSEFNVDTLNIFNKVKYYDEPHKYFIKDRQLISVTTLIHEYEPEFDEDYWANKKAKEYNTNSDNIKYIWKFINEKGTTKGSIIHDYTENLFLNKVFPYPKENIINHFGFDPIIKEYEITKNHVDRFYADSYDKLIPVKTELVVCDDEFGIGGMVDMLFYNVRKKEFQIWDWKTNKKFSYNKDAIENMLGPLSIFGKCDFNIYSIQLELYKYIIEKYTTLKLGNSYLVWFSHNNDNYKIIETQNMRAFIEPMLDDYFSKN